MKILEKTLTKIKEHYIVYTYYTFYIISSNNDLSNTSLKNDPQCVEMRAIGFSGSSFVLQKYKKQIKNIQN